VPTFLYRADITRKYGIGILFVLGKISPITPNRDDRRSTSTSPVVNAGDISRNIPATTVPCFTTAAAAMEVEEGGVDNLLSRPRPQSAYAPPPPAVVQSNTLHPPTTTITAVSEKDSFTPPPPLGVPPVAVCAARAIMPPLSLEPQRVHQITESGEKGGMSGFSDVGNIGDISPPRVSHRSPLENSAGEVSPMPAAPPAPGVRQPEPAASDVSVKELFTGGEEEEGMMEQSLQPSVTEPAMAGGVVGNNSTDSEG